MEHETKVNQVAIGWSLCEVKSEYVAAWFVAEADRHNSVLDRKQIDGLKNKEDERT